MPMTPKEIIRFLKKNGFTEVSQNGSHVKLWNSKSNLTVIVPVHNKTLKKGLEQAILKQSGLNSPTRR